MWLRVTQPCAVGFLRRVTGSGPRRTTGSGTKPLFAAPPPSSAALLSGSADPSESGALVPETHNHSVRSYSLSPAARHSGDSYCNAVCEWASTPSWDKQPELNRKEDFFLFCIIKNTLLHLGLFDQIYQFSNSTNGSKKTEAWASNSCANIALWPINLLSSTLWLFHLLLWSL